MTVKDLLDRAGKRMQIGFAQLPKPMTDEELVERTKLLEKQKARLLVGTAKAIPVRLSGVDDQGEAYLLEFEAFTLEVTLEDDGQTRVTKFSNGVVLTQRKVKP